MYEFNTRADYLDFAEVEEITLKSRKTINRWIEAGKFPPPIQFHEAHNATKYWEKKLILLWLEENTPKDKWRTKYKIVHFNKNGGFKVK